MLSIQNGSAKAAPIKIEYMMQKQESRSNLNHVGALCRLVRGKPLREKKDG